MKGRYIRGTQADTSIFIITAPGRLEGFLGHLMVAIALRTWGASRLLLTPVLG